MKDPCQVCHDSRVITLPFRTVMVEIGSDQIPIMPSAAYRKYPCPECVRTVPLEEARLLEWRGPHLAASLKDGRYRDFAERQAIAAFAGKIHEMGLLRFATEETGDERAVLRASIVIVSGATLDERVAERRAAEASFAWRVCEKAIASIWNWGSYYGRDHISKERAQDFIREAFKLVRDEGGSTDA